MTEGDVQTEQRGEQRTPEVEVSADRQPAVPEVPELRRGDVFLHEAEANTQSRFRPGPSSGV